MSDSYQAVYDAVRSRIGSCNPSNIIESTVREAFDISWQKQHLQQEIYRVSESMTFPHVLMRPRLFVDGRQWCALYGDDLQTGVAGFGESPALAMAAFDVAWGAKL